MEALSQQSGTSQRSGVELWKDTCPDTPLIRPVVIGLNACPILPTDRQASTFREEFMKGCGTVLVFAGFALLVMVLVVFCNRSLPGTRVEPTDSFLPYLALLVLFIAALLAGIGALLAHIGGSQGQSRHPRSSLPGAESTTEGERAKETLVTLARQLEAGSITREEYVRARAETERLLARLSCKKCGSVLQPDANFCTSCGTHT